MARKLKELEYDFELEGIGYLQDTDCQCWKLNLTTRRKSKISDNTYDRVYNQIHKR